MIDAYRASGYTSSLHPRGPKWVIQCGKCMFTWRDRINRIDCPTVVCSRCNEINRIPIIWG